MNCLPSDSPRVPPHPPFSPSPSSRLASPPPSTRIASPLPARAACQYRTHLRLFFSPSGRAYSPPAMACRRCGAQPCRRRLRARTPRPALLAAACVHGTSTTKRRRRRHLSQTYRRFASTTPVRCQCDSYTSAFFSSKPALRGRIPPGRHCLLRLCSPSIIRVRSSSGGSLKISFSQIHSPSFFSSPRQIHQTTTFHSSLCTSFRYPLISSIRHM